MSKVQEIARAIEKLNDEQVEELSAWLFDRDIARDAANGVLDFLAAEAIGDARVGRAKQL